MIKKTRLYVGIALVVQAFSCLIMFLILCTKKKSIASAFLAVAAMNGAAGAYLLYQHKTELSAEEEPFDPSVYFADDDFTFDDSMINADVYGNESGALSDDIPCDDEATEADFQ